jgi:hypothetical protein
MVLEDRILFNHFLMHGSINQGGSGAGTTLSELAPHEVEQLKTLVVEYLRVFPDPGLALFGSEEDERLRERARHPSRPT